VALIFDSVTIQTKATEQLSSCGAVYFVLQGGAIVLGGG